jgi:hypothetical protein
MASVSTNSANNLVNTPIKPKIKLRTNLNTEQKAYLVDSFNKLFAPGHNYQRPESWVYTKLNESFKGFLLSHNVFDLLNDCKFHLERIIKKAREDVEQLKNLNEEAARAVTENYNQSNVKKKSKRKANEANLDETLETKIDEATTKKPSGYSSEYWAGVIKMEKFYTQWQNSINKDNSDSKMDVDSDNKENINPNNSVDATTTPKITKKALEEAKKEAVDSFRSIIRTDAIRLLEERKEYVKQQTVFMNQSVEYLQVLKQREIAKEETQKKKDLLLEKSLQLIDKLLAR